jgi:hypothetical protein
MPVAIPLIAAGVGAAGSVVGSAMSNSSKESQQQKALEAQQAAAQQQQALGQHALGSQQALTAQGIQGQQQSFANAVLTPNLLNQQAGLTSDLQAASQGLGPNPALAQLQQTTGQNVANQAALMAGQRGAGANAGLLARQAAMQGAATQQQAVGQGASLAAQQQIAARGQLQSQLAGQQGFGLQAQQGAANTALANQAASNSIYGQMMGNTQSGANQAAGISGQAGLQQAANANAMNAGMIGGVGSAVMTGINGLQSSNNATQADLSSGKAMTDAMYKAQGGMIGYAQGGDVGKEVPKPSSNLSVGPKSAAGRLLAGIKQVKAVPSMMAHGGKVPALVSPGEKYLNPKEVAKVAEGKKPAIQAGEKIPGKAKVSGAKNSYANDTVPKTLEVGGIVLPRSVTQSKNPGKEAQKFVEAILAKKSLK